MSARTVVASLSLLLGAGWQAGLNASAGLSKGSADYGAGLGRSWQLPI